MADKNFKVKTGLSLPQPLPAEQGGTGQTSLSNVLNVLLPAQTSANGKMLSSDGTNPTWAVVPNEITYSSTAPSSPVTGQVWINTAATTQSFDPNIISRTTIVSTAGQTAYSASNAFVQGFEQVYFNGVLLQKTTDYTVSGSTVTLTSAAEVNDLIEILSITNLNSYNPNPYLSISANTSLLAGTRYYVTSSSALTLTLPVSPSLNDEIQIIDASGNASTYNITIARNGNDINNNAGNFIIDQNNAWVSLLYTGSTVGWKVA